MRLWMRLQMKDTKKYSKPLLVVALALTLAGAALASAGRALLNAGANAATALEAERAAGNYALGLGLRTASVWVAGAAIVCCLAGVVCVAWRGFAVKKPAK